MNTPGIMDTSSAITTFSDMVTKFEMEARSETLAESSIEASFDIPTSVNGFSLKSFVHLA